LSDVLNAVLGPDRLRSAFDRIRSASGGRIPKWSPALPRPPRMPPHRGALSDAALRALPGSARDPAPDTAERIVYFPSSPGRSMGAQRGDDEVDPLPEVAKRLFAKAAYEVTYPARINELCCGQPFESKGLTEAADRKSAELEAALRDASDGGRLPIVFDTSPCAYRMKRYLSGRIIVADSIEFVHDYVVPRVDLAAIEASVAIHPVCSVRKMGLVEKLAAI